jgi:hypothetical protein
MTDRELLELAAKAMGRKIKTKFYKADGWCAWWHHVISKNIDEWCDWNPHTDNADAFEMAVQLQLDVFHTDYLVRVLHRDHKHLEIELGVLDGRDTATRRAIVRAAAAIGEQND